MEAFDIYTSNEATCPVDESNIIFRRFEEFIPGTNGAAPLPHNKFEQLTRNEFTTELEGPGQKTYIVEITSTQADGKISNTV